MRSFRLALAGLLAAGSLNAQQTPKLQTPQPVAPAAAAPTRLDALLGRWEQEMARIESLKVTCQRTDTDKVSMRTDTYTGGMKYMKPNLALMEMQRKDRTDIYEKFLCTGTYIYQFMPQTKEILLIALPPGQKADDNLVSFLFGMKALEAKRRYDLRLVKEDPNYIYIEIVPKLASDKADFQKARLTLNARTFLPRMLWYMEPNGNEKNWDLAKVETNVKVDRTDFAPPTKLPAGWRMVQNRQTQPSNVPPTVVRPNR